MRQRLGVPANVAPNTRRTQFINHANYKIIYINVITGQMPQKYILPHLPNTISPPDEHAQCEDNVSTGKSKISKGIEDIVLELEQDGNVLFVFYEHKIRAVCNALLLCLFFAINCQSKASRALCSGISLTTTSIN